MRIALTLRVTEAEAYPERRDSISHDWIARLGEWGMMPLLVPNVMEDPVRFIEELSPDAIVLTGGDNIGVRPERDATERALLNHAIESRMPVLGVCRGLQTINLAMGGRLSPIEGHTAVRHGVQISGAWQSLYDNQALVNSYHDIGITKADLGADLLAMAHDDEDNVEGLVHCSLPIAAVMWHPERGGAPSADRQLLQSIIEDGAFWT